MLSARVAPLAAQAVGTIRGRVLAAGTQRPVADAQVTVLGSGVGALTGENGDFVLAQIPAGARQLQVRKVGFARVMQSVNVAAGGDARVDLMLNVAVAQLDATVVTGTAGATEKRTLGNAITQIDVADIVNKSSIDNVTEALQSKTPGLTLMPGSGTPGAAAEFRIRG
ncbi:MAG TPA: carboxypeptidase regulatory-like domain-containing protein, partial [Gemmatimonadaceae bacterium]|nr:carboxypeptidase regulatory-like domain-containing protein [Gemmatimonadaceae bacterium]